MDDPKHRFKVSYRVNGHIKSLIEKTNRDIRRKTGLDLSRGRIARTFWTGLADDPALRKKCINCICSKLLKEALTK